MAASHRAAVSWVPPTAATPTVAPLSTLKRFSIGSVALTPVRSSSAGETTSWIVTFDIKE